MCRVLRVVIVAPDERGAELRKKLSALDYEIVAAVPSPEQITMDADVAVVWEPDADTVGELKARGLKVAAVGGEGSEADLALGAEDLSTFRTRVWELFRPA